MTRIFLLSDTHGHMDERILHYAAQADEIWHAGDMGNLEVCDQLQIARPCAGGIRQHRWRQSPQRIPRRTVFSMRSKPGFI